MEGYKYNTNEKGVPTAMIEQGETEGIVPRSVRLLFDLIKQESNLGKKKFTVYCSYLQVYKEKIYDLLNKSHLKRLVTDGPGLKLKLVKDIFTVENLYTFECRSAEDVLALYHFGLKNRVVASHNMNNSSSRSHSMLKMTLECVDSKQPDNTILSTLQLVDLAGSERQS
jgi:kinesin family protein 4/21/27